MANMVEARRRAVALDWKGMLMNAVFRPRTSYLALGMISLLFFVGMGGVSCYAAAFEVPADRRIYFLILTLGVWGGMTCVSLWLLLACWRESLTIRENQITETTIFSIKEFNVDDVVEARWRVIPAGGSVVLKTAISKTKIAFHSFEREQRLDLIRFFRNVLPPSLQHDWPVFCYKIALPLRDAPVDRAPNEDEVRFTRQRLDWYFVPGILLATGMGVILWRMFALPRLLLSPLFIAALWLYLRWRTPKQGIVAKRFSAMFEEPRTAIAFLAMLVLAFPLAILGKLLEKQHPALSWLVAIPLLAIFPFILRDLVRKQRRQEEHALQAAPAAAKEWEQKEAMAS